MMAAEARTEGAGSEVAAGTVDTPEPVLEADGVAKTFVSGGQPIAVLKSAALALRSGESVSIRGESGSGKSTLLNILAGLERADGGEVRWGGEPISALSRAALARRRARFVGMVFQAYYLISELNVVENVLFAARILGRVGGAERARAEELLRRVGLRERLRGAPLQLSGGERQRVAVARALMNRPPVILADEPTGNLDEHTGEDVMSLLLEVCREEGAGLVLVTHNPEFARRAGRRLLLHDGVLAPAEGE